MNQATIDKILDYIEESLYDPFGCWPDRGIEQRSYAQWAAYAILNLLMDRPYDSPDIVIEEFMLKMSAYSHYKHESSVNRIFAVAEKTAEDILYLI